VPREAGGFGPRSLGAQSRPGSAGVVVPAATFSLEFHGGVVDPKLFGEKVPHVEEERLGRLDRSISRYHEVCRERV